MKKVIAIAVLLTLGGCANMTPGQKTAAWIVGGAVVVGAVAASGGSSDSGPNCYFAIRGDKSTRICN